MTQAWNFGSIEAGAGEIAGAVNRTQSLLDEGKAALAKLATAWGGAGSESYQAVQQRWDASSAELNASLQSLSNAIQSSGQAMSGTESKVTGMFA